MELTGKSIIVLGRKLYERTDGWYQDDRGVVFDYSNGKLYEQREPGKWFWLKSQTTRVQGADLYDRMFDVEF